MNNSKALTKTQYLNKIFNNHLPLRMSPSIIDNFYRAFDHGLEVEAWANLRRSLVHFRGQPVGTIVALDKRLNYDQVYVRDFVPSALAFLINGEAEIVKNFILKTLGLLSLRKKVDPTEELIADFAIGGVTPVDSGFWWIILLRAYTESTGDTSLAKRPECQNGIKLILNLCLSPGFDTFPTLVCADGCCMIDRRMGVHGYPIEVQALFFMALRCAMILLKPDGHEIIQRIVERIDSLSYHMRSYFWMDQKKFNDIYRDKTEEYSHILDIMPDSFPEWVFDFMPRHGGYFMGNFGPSNVDFRWFCLGNCIAILSSLATTQQANAIMDLIESHWTELVGDMPLKLCYPAMEDQEWRIVTGCDPKNTEWSYHNGGSWPVLLWVLTAACIKTRRHEIARRAIELAEARLFKDNWPEYYDGKLGRSIGEQANKHQIWSVAGYLVAKMMLKNPSHLGMIAIDEVQDKQMRKRSSYWESIYHYGIKCIRMSLSLWGENTTLMNASFILFSAV